MMDKIELGEYIRDARSMLGWTAERLGREFGVNRQTLNRWEKGKTTKENKLEEIEIKLNELLENNPISESGMYHREFGEFLYNMRKSVKWSKIKIGKMLGVHYSTIARWEKGQSLNNVDDIYILELNIREVVKEELKSRRNNQEGVSI